MAALLRATSSRVCKNILSFTSRNQLSYLRHARTPTIRSADSAFLPRFAPVKLMSDVTPGEKSDHEASQRFEHDEVPLDKRPPRQRIMAKGQYERMVQKLGTLSTKGSLFHLFESILAKDGGITQLQAYQMLRNCGKELIYESPQSRTDTAHVVWDKLLASGVQVDIMMYNALLSVYIQNDYDFSPLEVLEQIQDAGLEANLITMTLIIKGFGQKGDIPGVFKVLEFMKAAEMPVTEPVYAALIMAYWRNGDMESAKGVLSMMRDNGLDPGLESYTTLLQAHAENGDLAAIDETISEMQENKVYPNHTVYLSLIDVFAKYGKLDMLPKILEKPTVKRVVELEILSMMLKLGGRGDVDAALILMDFVPFESVSPPQTPQSLLLKQVITSKQAIDKIMKVVGTLNSQGIMRNVYETALHLSYGNKDPELSTTIIKEMIEKKIVVKEHFFYPILACFADKLDVKGTQDIVTLMAENDLDVDPISLNYIIKSFGQPQDADVDAFINLSKEVPLSLYLLKTIAQLVMESGNLDKLHSIFEYAVDQDIKDNSLFPQAFGRAMKSSFDPHNAVKILKELQKRNLTFLLPMYVSDVLESTCRQEHKAKQGAEFIHLILQEGLQDIIDSRSYTFVMKYLNIHHLFDDFYELIQVMKEHNIPLDEHQYRQMIRMFSYLGESRAAQFCFNSFKKLKEPDADLYTLLVSAYGQSKDGGFLAEPLKEHIPKKILKIYEEMKESDIRPKQRAKAFIIMSHLALGKLEEAKLLKGEFGPLGTLAYRVEAFFLKAYADKGDTENAAKVLETIKNADNMHLSAYTYTTAIGSYKLSGDIDSQRKLLEEMKEMKIKPTSFTYDELIGTYLLKEDIDGVLQILEEAKAANVYPTTSACTQLVKLCAKTAPEKLDSVVHEMVDMKTKRLSESSLAFFLHSLAFVCVSHGRIDVAEQIVQKLSHHSQHEYGKISSSFARVGDFEAILKCKAFMEEKNLDTTTLLIPLIRAYDAANMPERAREAYDEFVSSSGGRVWPGLQVILAKILRKHNLEVPFDVPERVQRQRQVDTEFADQPQLDSESHSDDEVDVHVK